MSALRDLACFWLVQIIPGWRGGLWDRLFLAMLPYAGRWAYRDHDFNAPSPSSEQTQP